MSDDICLKVVELYLGERKRGAAGGNLSSQCVRAAKETSYQWKAERCMADENCFKVQKPFLSWPPPQQVPHFAQFVAGGLEPFTLNPWQAPAAQGLPWRLLGKS